MKPDRKKNEPAVLAEDAIKADAVAQDDQGADAVAVAVAVAEDTDAGKSVPPTSD